MGLMKQGMVERATGTTDLELEAQANESLLVKKISAHIPSAAAQDRNIWIDQVNIQQWVALSTWYALAGIQSTGYVPKYNPLHAAGVLRPFPIASGQKLLIDGGVANSYTEVVYDRYDEGDITADMPNGTQSPEYDLIQVISNSSAVSAAGDAPLDQSDLDTAFPAFPGGANVPANHTMKLMALFGSPVAEGDGGASDGATTLLKFIQDRRDLFDKDLGGITFAGDTSHVAASTIYSPFASRLSQGLALAEPSIIVFDEPIVFGEGSELNVFATVTGAGTDLAASVIPLGLVFHVTRRP